MDWMDWDLTKDKTDFDAEREEKVMRDNPFEDDELDALETRDVVGIPPKRKKDIPTLARQYLPGTFIVKSLPDNLPEIDRDGLMPLMVAPSHDPENTMYVLVVRTNPQKIQPKVETVIHLTKIMYNGSTVYVYD